MRISVAVTVTADDVSRFAAKRTLKLLLKAGVDPNVLNLSGFTALQLAIMSAAAGRDDCTLYMLDGCGFDEDAITPDGKTWCATLPPCRSLPLIPVSVPVLCSLLLAAEHGRPVILRQLLSDGHDSQQPDYYGTTPLQAACRIGNTAIVSELLQHGADGGP